MMRFLLAAFAAGLVGGCGGRPAGDFPAWEGPLGPRIQISAGGQYTVDGQAGAGEDLADLIEQAASAVDARGDAPNDCEVAIEGDEAAACGQLRAALHACQQSGFAQFRLRIGDREFSLFLPPKTPERRPGFFVPPVNVIATAGPQGELAGVKCAALAVNSVTDLHKAVQMYVGPSPDSATQPNITITADDALKLGPFGRVLEAVCHRTDIKGRIKPLAMNVWPLGTMPKELFDLLTAEEGPAEPAANGAKDSAVEPPANDEPRAVEPTEVDSKESEPASDEAPSTAAPGSSGQSADGLPADAGDPASSAGVSWCSPSELTRLGRARFSSFTA